MAVAIGADDAVFRFRQAAGIPPVADVHAAFERIIDAGPVGVTDAVSARLALAAPCGGVQEEKP